MVYYLKKYVVKHVCHPLKYFFSMNQLHVSLSANTYCISLQCEKNKIKKYKLGDSCRRGIYGQIMNDVFQIKHFFPNKHDVDQEVNS